MKMNTLSWLWRVSAKDKGKILCMTILQILLGGAAVLSAWLLRGIIDCAVGRNDLGFWRFAMGLAGLTAGQLALRAVYRHLSESCRASLENRFKARLFGVLLERDYASVSAVHSAQWMNRLTSDTAVVADGITGILPEISGMVVKLLGALALLIVLLPNLMPVILIGGALMILLTWVFRRKLKQLHKAVQESDGQLRTFLTERLSAMLVLRAFGRQETANRQSLEYMEDHRRSRMKRNTFSNLCNIGFGIAIQGAYVLGAVYCGYGILTGSMSYGTFTAVLQLIAQIQSPFANLSGFLPRFYAALASAERLQEAELLRLDCPEGSLSSEEAAALYEHLTAIEYSDVSFAYPGEAAPAVQKLNMVLKKGKYIAFTGHSGCGKSTALKLLLAIYCCDSGELLLHSDETTALSAKHRKLFAYVPQGNMLMSGTIRDVVAFGAEKKPTDQEIWTALKVACADAFVAELEKGLDTVLGERGVGLSEGQLQRLAIARAICADRPILLLDEATAALDEATEAALLQNLRKMTDKTVLIVTHRPAALEICDEEICFE